MQGVGGGHTSPGLKRGQSLTKDSTYGSVASCPVDSGSASAPGEANGHGAAAGGTYVPGTVQEGELLATKDTFAANGAPVMRRSSPGQSGSGKSRRSGLFGCCSAASLVLEDENDGPCVMEATGSGGDTAMDCSASVRPGLTTPNGSVNGMEGSNKSASIVRARQSLSRDFVLACNCLSKMQTCLPAHQLVRVPRAWSCASAVKLRRKHFCAGTSESCGPPSPT